MTATLRRHLLVAGLALATSLAGGACSSSPNTLEGSLSDVYGLEFDQVDAQLVGNFLVVQYLKSASGARTLKMAVDLQGYTVSPGAPISLTEMAAGGSPRGTLQRIVETTINLPLSTGSVTLDAVPTAGSPLSGSFSATFTMPQGRSLHGEFRVDAVKKP